MVDVTIRGLAAPALGIVSHFLIRMPATPLANPLPRHPQARNADRSARRRPPVAENDWWELWFNSVAVEGQEDAAHSGIRFESQVLDGHVAIAGHGIAILSPPMFQAAIDAGLLVQPFPHVANYGNAFWLVYPEHKRNMPKVRAFRDWLLDQVRAAAGDDPYGILEPLPPP